jgi:hypothetical protein
MEKKFKYAVHALEIFLLREKSKLEEFNSSGKKLSLKL